MGPECAIGRPGLKYSVRNFSCCDEHERACIYDCDEELIELLKKIPISQH